VENYVLVHTGAEHGGYSVLRERSVCYEVCPESEKLPEIMSLGHLAFFPA
jgi:hypothetical protein